MILVLTAHPDTESFNAALAEEAVRGVEEGGETVEKVDLYRMGEQSSFPPVLHLEELRRKTSLDPVVQAQMRLLFEADGCIVIHPDWWGAPPAILKGWVDRVLRPGIAYEHTEGHVRQDPRGLLAGRSALVFVTGDAENPGPLREFWLNRVWAYCSVNAEMLYFPRIGESSRAERRAFAAQCRMAARKMSETI